MTHIEEQVQAYYTIIIDNNFNGVVTALNRYGYPTSGFIQRAELQNKLYKLYQTAPTAFFKIMKSVPINENANNYTTSEAIKTALINTVEGIKNGYHI